MDSFSAGFKRLAKRRSLKFGVPFLVMIVGGSFGLREFTSLRYQFRNTKQLTKEEAEKEGIAMKESTEVTLETEFEKIKNLDIDNWENKRGPRPWEENFSQKT